MLGRIRPLTTGRDHGAAYTGGAGADSFEGTDATLTSFDGLNGGAGDDTLELTFGGGVAGVPSGVSVSSIENITIDTTAAVGVDISGWSGVEDVAVTAFGAAELISAASNAVSVTATGNINIADSTAGAVFAQALGKYDITVNADSASEVVLVSGGASVHSIDVNAKVITSLLVDVAGATVDVDTESSALAVSVEGDAIVVENSADKAVTNLSVTALSASKLDLDFAAATSLAISGATAVDVVATGLGAVKSVTASGSVDVSGDFSGIAKLTTITSTSTGDMDLTIAATATSVTLAGGDDIVTQAAALGKTQNISLGDGDDTFVAGGALTAGATVAGGDGDDTLSITSAVAISGDNASAIISGFEVLEVSDQLLSNLDVGNFDSIQDVVLVAGSASADISGLATGASVTYVGANAGTSTLKVTSAAAGSADVINLAFDATGEKALRDYQDIAVADVETINIQTIGVAKNGDAVQVGLTDDHTTLVVTGEVDLTIDTVMKAVTTVDASAFDALLIIDLTGNVNDVAVTAGDGDNVIIGGAGDDTITVGDGDNYVDGGTGDNIITAGDGDNKVVGGTGIETITTGAGDDTINTGDGADVIDAGDGANKITGGKGGDTMTGGDDVDTYYYNSVLESNGVNIDTITNFDADEDVLDFNFILAGLGSYVGEANGLSGVLSSLTGSKGQSVFDTSTDLLYVDADGDALISAGDLVIELTGVTSLEAANFVF